MHVFLHKKNAKRALKYVLKQAKYALKLSKYAKIDL